MQMNYWKNQLQIGSRSVGRFIGSPLDGVTNVPFRQAARLFSPQALMYTEICHCDTIVNTEPPKWGLDVGEAQINFQMCASDKTFIERACERVLAQGVTMVDINIGCPAKTVVNTGAGSALMADVPKLKSIIKLFRTCLPITLTVKMRAGFKEPNALAVAQMLQDLGVDALCVHPRLQSQGFSGEPDYALVGQIKQAVSIPVLVSGGISSWPIAKAVYESTGVDGFLIGRALTGHPWLLDKLTKESHGQEYTLSQEEMYEAMMRHLDFAVAWMGPSRGLAYFKKHLKVYLADLGFDYAQSVALLSTEAPDIFVDLCNNMKK